MHKMRKKDKNIKPLAKKVLSRWTYRIELGKRGNNRMDRVNNM